RGAFSHFFFSSRRRHTRFSRDWSSDVCSSDLALLQELGWALGEARSTDDIGTAWARVLDRHPADVPFSLLYRKADAGFHLFASKIGRASCRERVSVPGGALSGQEREAGHGALV